MKKQVILLTGLLFLSPITEGFGKKNRPTKARWYNYRIPKREVSFKDGTMLFVQYTSINGVLHMDDVQRWEILNQALTVLTEKEIEETLSYHGYFKRK